MARGGMVIMTRLEMLKEQFNAKLEEFGSPERNMTERRRMLRQLRDMEQELDKLYGLQEE